MGELISRKELVKQGMKGTGGIVGGGILLILRSIGGVFGWIVGGLLTVMGFGILTSKEDRLAGIVTTGVGILTLVSQIPGVGNIAESLMLAGAIGLLAGGGYSLIKFIINLNKRR